MFVFRLLLSWRSKLRRFLAKKLKEAKEPGQEIRYFTASVGKNIIIILYNIINNKVFLRSLSSGEEESDTDEKQSKKKVAGKDDIVDKGEEDEEEEMEKKLAELKAEEIAELKR